MLRPYSDGFLPYGHGDFFGYEEGDGNGYGYNSRYCFAVGALGFGCGPAQLQGDGYGDGYGYFQEHPEQGGSGGYHPEAVIIL